MGRCQRAPGAQEAYGARLRSFLARLFHEGDFRADLESIERMTQHRVLVEVDVATIGRGEKTVSVCRHQPGHAAAGQRDALLDLAAALPHLILEAPSRFIERFMERNI